VPAPKINWPFKDLPEGEQILLPWGYQQMSDAELPPRTRAAIATTKNRTGNTLSAEVTRDGVMVKMVKRVTAIGPEPGKAKLVKAGSHKRRSRSSNAVRFAFWRAAYLKAMDNVPLSELTACTNIANGALAQYDQFVLDEYEAGSADEE
jgi:hypothetical protein